MPVRYGFVVAIIMLLSTPAFAAEGVKISDLVVAAPLSEPQATTNLNAIRAFYDFWNTGDENLLKQAIAASSTDRTLPPGRPQGPEGPAFAPGNSAARCPTLKWPSRR